MTFKNLLFIVVTSVLLASCVTAKIHEELQDKFETLKTENASLMSQLDTAPGASSMGKQEQLLKNAKVKRHN
jgi:outer membrane lipoprotein-sorting protein